jgi:signal transduction histidine kinase
MKNDSAQASTSQVELTLLNKRNEQLLATLEMSDSGVMHAEAKGAVTYVNRTLLRMLGIDPDWKHPLTLISVESHLRVMLDADEPMRRPIDAILDEMRFGAIGQMRGLTNVIKLASPKPAVLQINARETSDGDLVFHFRDITVEFEVDRMKSEFLATAAHELRTPLSSILGFTELMIDRVMAPEKQRGLLQTVHKQGLLLADLINELLDLSRIEARQGKDFHRQQCRVDSIVRQTISGLLIKGDKRQVSVKFDHDKHRILVDPDKTAQALLNVLSNAFKYSPQGGAIELDTLVRDLGAVQEVGIRVTDHGLGLTPEDAARVFNRFFRVDPSGKIPGTGLGMSLVKEITELQDGHVEIESQLGQGTSITLWFPTASDFLLSQPFPLDQD